MKSAVEDKLKRESAVVVAARLIRQVDRGVPQEVRGELEAFGKEPEREDEDESEAGRVAEEVELVRTAVALGERVGFGLGGLVEELLGDDVLGDEEERATEGGDKTEQVGGDFD